MKQQKNADVIQNNDAIMSKLSQIYSSNTTFLQNLKNVALPEQMLDRGNENIRAWESQKVQTE